MTFDVHSHLLDEIARLIFSTSSNAVKQLLKIKLKEVYNQLDLWMVEIRSNAIT